ncbi:Mitochondrial acidic protein mam33, partial [Kappamyces sp. JEL0829]
MFAIRNVLSQSVKAAAFRPIVNVRFMSKGAVDSTIVKKLKEERAFELENQEDSEWISEFTSRGDWKEVSLVKTFGNEKITAIFSTDSLEEQDMDFEGQEEDAAPDAPIAVSIIVEKDGQEGALEVTSTVQGESFFIDNVSFIASAKLAQDQTAEGDWSRRGKFSGPVFADLDESV